MSKVAIVKGKDPQKALRDAFDLLGGIKTLIRPGKRILIKPNLVYPALPPVTTNPKIIESVVQLVKETNPKEIWIGESSSWSGKSLYGVGHWDNKDVFTKTKIVEVAKRTGAKILNFDEEDVLEVDIPEGIILRQTKVFRPVLEADFLINIPVLKTHNETLVTLGIKNLHGTIHDSQKMMFHRNDLPQKLVDLSKKIKSHLTIIDGIVGMEGFGPTMGRGVRMDTLILSTDIVAADACASAVMGIDPLEVETTRLAYSQGLGVADLGKIEVVGETLDRLKRDFKRPDASVAGVYPDVRVISGGTCHHCYVRAKQFLELLRKHKLLEKIGPMDLLIGTNPRLPDLDEIGERTYLLVGDCSIFSARAVRQLIKNKAILLDGCPPVFSVYDTFRKLRRKLSSKESKAKDFIGQ